MYGCALTAKCKYDKNRCLPAEVLCGDAAMVSGLLGSDLWNLLSQRVLFLLVLRPHVGNKGAPTWTHTLTQHELHTNVIVVGNAVFSFSVNHTWN